MKTKQTLTKNKIQFSDFGIKHKLTVNSHLDIKDNHLLYDKKMSTILLCMEYSQAFSEGNVDNDLQARMYNLIDEAFNAFKPLISSREKEFSIIKNNIDNLKTAGRNCNLLMAYEIIGVQLTKLRSLISENGIDGIYSSFKIEAIDYDKFDEFHQKNQQAIAFGRTECFKKVIPVYSANTVIGLNTILFALFNDFLPVGFGEKPLSVHNSLFKNQFFNHLSHDYGHIAYIYAMKTQQPHIFEQYKQIYFQLFNLKKEQKIDDITFKKNILALFYLTYDIAFYPEMHLQDTSCGDVMYRLKNDDLLYISDYVVGLKDLGFFPNREPTEDDIRNAMMDLLQGFSHDYPDVELKLTRNKLDLLTNQAQQDPSKGNKFQVQNEPVPSEQGKKSEESIVTIEDKLLLSQQGACSLTNMQILGGFIAVLGIAAVAIAFSALSVGIIPVAYIGVAMVIGGIGLFAKGNSKEGQNSLPHLTLGHPI